jgi:glucuronosyltransferase
VEKLRDIFRDEREGPLERVIWWTEYVLRHGGAKHLRSSAANVSLTEYYMIDYALIIAGILIAIASVIIFTLIYTIRLVVNTIKSYSSIKKKSVNKIKKK